MPESKPHKDHMNDGDVLPDGLAIEMVEVPVSQMMGADMKEDRDIHADVLKALKEDLVMDDAIQLPEGFNRKKPNEHIATPYNRMVRYLEVDVGLKSPEWQADWLKLAKGLDKYSSNKTEPIAKKMLHDYEPVDPRGYRALQEERGEPQPEFSFTTQEADVTYSIDKLLLMSGFLPVTAGLLRAAHNEKSHSGMDVHVPDQNEVKVQVFYRELKLEPEAIRTWKSCFKEQERLEKYFGNFFMMYSYKNYIEDKEPDGLWKTLFFKCNAFATRKVWGPKGSRNKVYLRLFDNIPVPDADMLWPGSSPNPKMLDIVMVMVPFLIGLGSAIYKLWTLMSDEHVLSDGKNLSIILLAVVAPFAIAFKTFQKALGKYSLYRANLTKLLVDRTVAIDKGAILLLLKQAADQEKKEFLLAYTIMALSDYGLTLEEVKQQVEALHWISSTNKKGVLKFDIDGALRAMDRVGVLDTDADGKLLVKSPVEALRLLDIQRL